MGKFPKKLILVHVGLEDPPKVGTKAKAKRMSCITISVCMMKSKTPLKNFLEI